MGILKSGAISNNPQPFHRLLLIPKQILTFILDWIFIEDDTPLR